MLWRVQKERITVSVDGAVAARLRQCGARTRGGASGYVERLVRQDELQEAVDAMARWYAQDPDHVDASEAERIAAAEDLDESA